MGEREKTKKDRDLVQRHPLLMRTRQRVQAGARTLNRGSVQPRALRSTPFTGATPRGVALHCWKRERAGDNKEKNRGPQTSSSPEARVFGSCASSGAARAPIFRGQLEQFCKTPQKRCFPRPLSFDPGTKPPFPPRITDGRLASVDVFPRKLDNS